MVDTVSSASTKAPEVVPLTVHKSAVANLVTQIEAYEAEVKKLWSSHEVLFIALLSFIVGVVIGSLV